VSETTDDQRKPIAEVLKGLEIHPLDAGWTAIEALVLMKCLDEEGRVTWAYRTTHRLNREELLGALVVHTDVLRRELAHAGAHHHTEPPPPPGSARL
jgi:hypothetical protein